MDALPAGDDRLGATASPNQFDPAAHAQMECFLRDFGEMYQEVTRAHHEALFRLALAAEYRDNDTGEHIIRMGFLSEALALALGAATAGRRCCARLRRCTMSARSEFPTRCCRSLERWTPTNARR